MLDGEQMNFFRKLIGVPEAKKIQIVEAKVMQSIVRYLQDLTLPYPKEPIRIELCDGNQKKRFGTRGGAQWYLLIFGKSMRGAFNAGYLLKQGLELLRSRQIPAIISKQMPELIKDGTCFGVLAIGVSSKEKPDADRESTEAEHFLVCQRREALWSEEIISLAEKLLTPDLMTGVRMIRCENVIHIGVGHCFGRNKVASEFRAGVVLGALMAAAEKLWIDLDMVCLESQQAVGLNYRISVCRKEDREKLLTNSPGVASDRNMRLEKHTKEHQWKYA